MPYAYTIRPDERLARIRLIGAVEGSEITAAWHAAVSDPAWEYGFGSLWDASGISLHILLDDIEAFSAQAGDHAKLRGPGRTAIVTTDVSVHINALLLCLKSKGRDEREFRIFQRVEDAEAWLTAPPPGEADRSDALNPTDTTAPVAEQTPPAQWEKRAGFFMRVATHPRERAGR